MRHCAGTGTKVGSGETERGVVATFIIDWPVLAFFGLLFGDHSPAGSWWRSPAFAGGLIASGGFTTVAMLSYGHAPDWMWMYYKDPDDMKPIVPFMPLGYMLTFIGGFVAALRLRVNDQSIWPAAAGAVAAEAAVVAATWDRYHRIGTRAEWEQGTASELVTTKPEGLAKRISSYGPIVLVTFLLGLFLARRSGASSTRR